MPPTKASISGSSPAIDDKVSCQPGANEPPLTTLQREASRAVPALRAPSAGDAYSRRPFPFWIVDEPTKAVLFLGRVLDPMA
jgi:hypothetical protein